MLLSGHCSSSAFMKDFKSWVNGVGWMISQHVSLALIQSLRFVRIVRIQQDNMLAKGLAQGRCLKKLFAFEPQSVLVERFSPALSPPPHTLKVIGQILVTCFVSRKVGIAFYFSG